MTPGAVSLFGVGYDTLLALIVGVVTFLSVVSLWGSLVEDRPRASRVRALVRRRLELNPGQDRRQGRRRGRSRAGLLGLAAHQLRRLRAGQTEKGSAKLQRAGFRSREAAAIYLGARLLSPALSVAGALALGSWLGGPVASGGGVFALAILLPLGLFAPDLYLANKAAKRRQALQKALPDSLDLLVICAEAGLTLDAALNRVADEIGPSYPELADELTITSVELNFLPERRLALLNLAKRVDLPAVRGVVNTLVQTERYGTPLAQSLRVLSAELREQRMLRAEEKAARLPATLTVPMIVFILPTLFVILVGPALLDVLDRVTR